MKHVKLFEDIVDITEGPEKTNQKFVTSPRPNVEPAPQGRPWNQRTAFNRDLTKELQSVCNQYSKFLPPSDIKQALIEMVHEYEDKENESK